ncbi:hypothetical protein RB593_007238 [Gaeumannomyces tritici]
MPLSYSGIAYRDTSLGTPADTAKDTDLTSRDDRTTMAPQTYFERVRSRTALRKHMGSTAPLRQWLQSNLRSASSWSTTELYASRVVVRHVRGGVLQYPDPTKTGAVLTAPPEQPGEELSKIIAPLRPGEKLPTETELVHRLGGTAGVFWAALHCCTHPPAASVPQDRMDSWLEDTTVQLASTFLRHALIYCPLQLVSAGNINPRMLLEFSGVRQRMVATLGTGGLSFEATADGKVAVLYQNSTGHFTDRKETVALLDAKKRVKKVREGKPIFTDQVLGQIVGEALALRLSQAAKATGLRNETIVVISAVKHYLCFAGVHIPAAYVEKNQNRGNEEDEHGQEGEQGEQGEEDGEDGEDGEDEEDEEDEEESQDEDCGEIITLRVTDWLDLSMERCRQLACENIAAFVNWQQKVSQSA